MAIVLGVRLASGNRDDALSEHMHLAQGGVLLLENSDARLEVGDFGDIVLNLWKPNGIV